MANARGTLATLVQWKTLPFTVGGGNFGNFLCLNTTLARCILGGGGSLITTNIIGGQVAGAWGYRNGRGRQESSVAEFNSAHNVSNHILYV